MHMPDVKKFGKRVLQIGLPAIILALFIYQVNKNWAELTAYTFQLNPWLLALAFLGFMLQELSYGLIWRAVLARLGSHLGLRTCLRIYLASEFVRYIPGNVWHVLTRILWVGKYGVSRPVAFASMAIELITKLAAGILVFSISLLFWQDVGKVGSLLRGSLLDFLGIASIIALFIGLHPRILNAVLNWALRRMKREPIQLTLRYSDILFITLAWCASWIFAGTAFYIDRKSTRLNSSHSQISYAVFCLKKKKKTTISDRYSKFYQIAFYKCLFLWNALTSRLFSTLILLVCRRKFSHECICSMSSDYV